MLTKDKHAKLIEIFCDIDDFLICLREHLDVNPRSDFKMPRFEGMMAASEVLTIIIFYQFSGLKCFQYYYSDIVQKELLTYFPNQVGYKRFLQLISKSWSLMHLFAQWRCIKSERTGIYYIDSKKLPVCHNRRIHNHKVFSNLAERGRTSTGWFYGLKIHFVINNLGQCMNFRFTSGNVHDSNPGVLRHVLSGLHGNCYGDKGYLTKIFEELLNNGIKVVTKIRKNMKNKLMPLSDKYQLFKRGIVESVFDILMTVFDIEHTRHRNSKNGFAHMVAAVAAYSFMDNKPTVLVPKMLA